MSTTLFGYGPHSIAADGDYDVACVGGRPGRTKILTIGLDRTGGTFSIKSRKAGSTDDFAAQGYTNQAGTVVTTDLTADAAVQVDCTGKDIRITGSATSVGTLKFDIASEQ